jgi:hypothetical protein
VDVSRVQGKKKEVKKIRSLKASIPGVQTTFHQSHDIRYFAAFAAVSVHLKKSSGGLKRLIGPPCHGKNFACPFSLLRRTNGNKSKAAAISGLTRSTFIRYWEESNSPETDKKKNKKE